MTDANNNAILLPGAYSYGPHVHWIDPSVASTKGNVDSTMLTDGIELGDLYTRPTVTIGGNSAATEPGNSAATEPLGGHEVQVTLPGGNPGWADLTITLPDGTSETTKNMVQNLAQYATLTSPIYTSAVYDSTRDLFYLAGAGSGVGVFSPETQTFLQPMQASFVTSNAVLSSLAITPDNSKLLASDPEDQKVLVFDLTNGTSTAVSVLWGTPQGPITAPMPVATISGDRALVIVTSWWEYDSPQMQSNVEELDLSQMTMQIRTDVESAGVFSVPPWMIASSADGSVALLGAEVNSDQHSPSYAWRYDAASDAFSTPMTYSSAGGDIVAVDGDGTVLNVGGTSVDQNLLPLVPNLSLGTAGLLTETGALYYTVGSQVGISDSRNGATLLLLPIFPYQGGSGDMAGAFAIDPTGQKILVGFGPSLYYYELAVVPLAVGTVSPAVATPGTSLTIRGDGFVAGTTVNIAGQISTCTMIDNETLQCVVPDVSAGLEPMTLSNPDGQTYSLEAAVNVQ
jgi:hypothetical protein